jgi:hypothetical protein
VRAETVGDKQRNEHRAYRRRHEQGRRYDPVGEVVLCYGIVPGKKPEQQRANLISPRV